MLKWSYTQKMVVDWSSIMTRHICKTYSPDQTRWSLRLLYSLPLVFFPAPFPPKYAMTLNWNTIFEFPVKRLSFSAADQVETFHADLLTSPQIFETALLMPTMQRYDPRYKVGWDLRWKRVRDAPIYQSCRFLFKRGGGKPMLNKTRGKLCRSL